MLAARSSGAATVDPASRLRKLSVASISGLRAHRNSQDNSRESRAHSLHQQAALQRARKAAIVREIETNWYLKLYGLAREDTIAYQTRMPYR